MENKEIIAKEMKYAGFGVRLSAYLIDVIIFMSIAYLIWGAKVVSTSNGLNISLQNEEMILPFLYFLISWIAFSSSIGKLVFRLKIVNKDGEKMKIQEVLIRSIVFIIMIIGVWFILGNKKKQALHDLAAQTYVIYNK